MLNLNKIIGVLDPTNPQDVVTKAFGDANYGGGSQTPITQDVDYDGFDIKDLSNVEFRVTTGAPTLSTTAIWSTSDDMVFNVPSSKDYSFRRSGLNIFVIGDDVSISPDIDINLEPNGDVIMNPIGEMKVFADLDMQSSNTIDFGTSASVPGGSALGAAQIKINGVTRLVKFYSV